jgi:hypothetical protein
MIGWRFRLARFGFPKFGFRDALSIGETTWAAIFLVSVLRRLYELAEILASGLR